MVPESRDVAQEKERSIAFYIVDAWTLHLTRWRPYSHVHREAASRYQEEIEHAIGRPMIVARDG
jgi:hypothetical protein